MIRVMQEIVDLTYSNITAETAWDDATNYAISAEIRLGNYIYKSVATPNLNKVPTETLGVYWIYWGVSNAYAAIDLYEDTTTTWVGDGIIEFARGKKDTLGIGNYVADNLKIEYRDSLGTVLHTVNIATSKNQNVFDLWDYIYADFTFGQTNVAYIPLLRIGTNIRVTFEGNGSATSCGYMVAGVAIDMGLTLDQVSFPDRRIGSRTINVANFDTILGRQYLMRATRLAKSTINIPQMFIIDPSEQSSHENMIIIGKITKCDAVAEVARINKVSWEIEQNTEEV